jgi:rhodanese-related sulfurtransferase
LGTRKIIRQIILLFTAAAVPALGSALLHPKRPAWSAETLAPGEVLLQTARGWGDGVLWIDARPAADFEKAHIPAALPLNEDQWNAQLPVVLQAWSRDKSVVVYCSSLSCQASREVARRLREEAKLPRVFVLKGGWESWLVAEGKK